MEQIEQKLNPNATNAQHKDSHSLTDNVIQKISQLFWQPSIPNAPEKALDVATRDDIFQPVIRMLERSAREFQNNDALLLLAELHFVNRLIDEP